MSASIRVLVVDDDDAMREALSMRVEKWGYDVLLADSGTAAAERVSSEDPDIVVTDVVLPGMSGLDLLEHLQADGKRRPIILITAHGSVSWAVEAMKKGAMDFLTKPVDYDHLASLLDAAAEEIGLRGKARGLESELEEGAGLGPLVGKSRGMRETFEMVELLAANEASAILVGESGVGKELVARTIHELSRRRDGPFLAVNTAAIPEGLIESEIFGHEKGAFTGASSARPGCFEQADGGTLLLDEIGDMPAPLQPRLLRVLEERQARRLGGSREIDFDVRVLAATNRDVNDLLEDGLLREDLFFRLNVFTIEIPPLREHPEDIPLLAQHFVRRFNEKHGTAVEGLKKQVLERLQEYPWPGNVRELRNIIERATILSRGGWIEPTHLPPYVRQGGDRERAIVLPIGVTAAEAEKRLILETLEAVDGNKTEAARRLQLDPKTIYNKLKAYEQEGPS